MINKNNCKSNKLGIASTTLDIVLQKLEFIIKDLLNIAITINLFQASLMFDNKSQVNNDIQEP